MMGQLNLLSRAHSVLVSANVFRKHRETVHRMLGLSQSSLQRMCVYASTPYRPLLLYTNHVRDRLRLPEMLQARS